MEYRHRHADLIVAHFMGADIEIRLYDDIWNDVTDPTFNEYEEYRIRVEDRFDYRSDALQYGNDTKLLVLQVRGDVFKLFSVGNTNRFNDIEVEMLARELTLTNIKENFKLHKHTLSLIKGYQQ